MCQSLAHGGQRCAAYARPRYQSAPFGTPDWDDAAATYASTPEDLYRTLAADDDQQVRSTLARNRNLTKQHLAAAADSPATPLPESAPPSAATRTPRWPSSPDSPPTPARGSAATSTGTTPPAVLLYALTHDDDAGVRASALDRTPTTDDRSIA